MDIINENTLLKEYIQHNDDFITCCIPVKTDLDIVKMMLLYEQERKGRPTVLFSSVQDYSGVPVLMNAFKKQVMYRCISQSEQEPLPVLYERYRHYTPEVNVQKPQNLTELDSIYKMPVLKHQPGDAGFYITAGVTATKNPVTGQVNLGIYRIQTVDKHKALIFMDPKSDGYKNYTQYKQMNRKMPVSVFIGANMAHYLCGAAKLPYQEDYLAVSKLLGNPVALYEFEVPAPVEAQFIITGFICEQSDWEGPFGEFKGFYCEKALAPVLEVDKIFCCNKPFYTSIAPGKESGLSLMAIQGECLMYFYLRDNGYNVSSVTYRLEESGEFVAVIDTFEPGADMVKQAFAFDKRLKFVICGEDVNDPWRQLSIFPFMTIEEDYIRKGTICGKKVGFILTPRKKMKHVEIF